MGLLKKIRSGINKANQGYRPVYWTGQAIETKRKKNSDEPVGEQLKKKWRENTGQEDK